MLFAVLAVLLDLLVQGITVFAVAAVVAGLVRGDVLEAPFFVLLLVAAGGLGILDRRIRGRRRTIHVLHGGSAEVSTISWGHFVSDAVFILGAAAVLVAMEDPAWDTAARAGAAAVQIACVALCGLRVAVARAARADGD